MDFIDSNMVRTSTFIRDVEAHDTLDSTSNRAADLARNPNIELPALVIARHQTAGRGRGNNKWWSAEGALTFSVVLEPATFGISTANWPPLSLATAVAICDALEQEFIASDNPQSERSSPAAAGNPQSFPRVAVKWPNDVMLDGAKVAGILIESPGAPAPAKDRLIIGIGINVNNSWQTAPRDVGPNGTALCDATKTPHNLHTVLVSTLRALQLRVNQLALGDPRLPDAWQRLCWLTEQGVDVHVNQRWITGVCAGIDRDGALMVEDINGIHRIRSGSVRVL